MSSCSSVLLTGVGSISNTSSPAPARCPEVSAACSAGSSMMPPRAVLTMNAPRFMRASRAALNMPTVSGFFGQWIDTKSARGSAASRSVTRSQPADGDLLRRHIRIVDQHVHVEALAAPRRARADAAEADDQHGLAGQLHRQPAVAVAPRCPCAPAHPAPACAWPAPSSGGTHARPPRWNSRCPPPSAARGARSARAPRPRRSRRRCAPPPPSPARHPSRPAGTACRDSAMPATSVSIGSSSACVMPAG